MVRLHPLPFCYKGKGQKVILRFIRRTVSCIQKSHGALTVQACMDGFSFLFFLWGGKIFLWCPVMVTFHSQWSASLTDKDTNKLLQLQPWESSYLGVQILILHPAGSVFVKDAFSCRFLKIANSKSLSVVNRVKVAPATRCIDYTLSLLTPDSN